MAKAQNKKPLSVLPYNEQAEKAVIGSALLDNDSLFTVISQLDEDDFYVGRHQIIFRVIKNLLAKHIAVDTLTATEELINIKEYENIGGVEYLKECCDSMVAFSALDFYIRIVQDQSVLRKLLISVRDIDGRYRTQEIDNVNDFIMQAEQDIKVATEKRRISEFKSTDSVSKTVAMQMNNPANLDSDGVIGITSGYDRINKYTQGFQKGDMIIVAARPSVGKTALALNFAYRAATRTKSTVAIFSLEMPSEQLVRRLLASRSNVNLKKIQTGILNDIEKSKINSAMKEVASASIFIDDTPGLKLLDIVAQSRKLQASHPDLGLIIVDYLGLVQMGSAGKASDSRQEEVRKISLGLKELARELKVPIIVVSQLSRNTEQRGDNKRPMLSDLRDSGSIEQDADVVMLLYRDDYYKAYKKNLDDMGNKKAKDVSENDRAATWNNKRAADLTANLPQDASYVEVNIAKNRNGQTGTVGLIFYKNVGLFDEPSAEWEEEMNRIRNGLQG